MADAETTRRSRTSRYERNFADGLEGKYRKVAEQLQDSRTVLDVGGSSGYFAGALEAAGHQVVVLDADESSVETARQRGLEAYRADLDSSSRFASVAGRKFDAILFMDVLEHLVDPQEVLRSARQLLAPGGRIIITGPNVAYWAVRLMLLRGDWNHSDTGIMDRTHLRWFTRATWQDLVEAAGYEVVRCVACEGMMPKEQWLRRILSDNALGRLREAMLALQPRMWATVFLLVAQAHGSPGGER